MYICVYTHTDIHIYIYVCVHMECMLRYIARLRGSGLSRSLGQKELPGGSNSGRHELRPMGYVTITVADRQCFQRSTTWESNCLAPQIRKVMAQHLKKTTHKAVIQDTFAQDR